MAKSAFKRSFMKSFRRLRRKYNLKKALILARKEYA